MNIPETIKLKSSLFGDGEKGYARQQHRNDEFGVQLDAVRKQHGAPWVETWTSDYLPHREFLSFAALRAALLEAVAVQPVWTVTGVEPKSEGSMGHCWLCRGDWVHTVIATRGWRSDDINHLPSCDGCLEAVKADPAAALEARRKHCREFDALRASSSTNIRDGK